MMNNILVDKELLEKAARTLYLLGKYSNNGIDTKIDALMVSNELSKIINHNK